ncbi:LuxR C-terminal-related transcriptional regulator [Paraburkholderia kururiensis]|uniref:response regulator transcription factor n=1 Tax=Paraburkholderia kururiensis TaxID=984307 RepID=UPI001F309956|nr:response regulator transcription factor [Paraburkholderia kururiensis]
MNRITVGIAHGHPAVLLGLKSFIESASDIDILFCVDSVEKLFLVVRERPVDVLLCQYEFDDLSNGDGLNLLDRMRAINQRIRVLFLTSNSGIHVISAALARGAAGFIGKEECKFERLADAIRMVHGGNIYLPLTMANSMLSNIFRDRCGKIGAESLSPRELEVVRMICSGQSIIEIAKRLSRSPKTISNQKNSAMRKLAVRNDVELANAARDLGIL